MEQLNLAKAIEVWWDLSRFGLLDASLRELGGNREPPPYEDRREMAAELSGRIFPLVEPFDARLSVEQVRKFVWSVLMLAPEEPAISGVRYPPILPAVWMILFKLGEEALARGDIDRAERDTVLEKLSLIVGKVAVYLEQKGARPLSSAAADFYVRSRLNPIFSDFSLASLAYINTRIAREIQLKAARAAGPNRPEKDGPWAVPLHGEILPDLYPPLEAAFLTLAGQTPSAPRTSPGKFWYAVEQSCYQSDARKLIKQLTFFDQFLEASQGQVTLWR